VSQDDEAGGKAIRPTPTIGGVGLIEDVTRTVGAALPAAGLTLILVGETAGHLGSSLYLREILDREDGAPPPVDLTVERKIGDFVRAQIILGSVKACHDVSDGGTLLAVAEMAVAGNCGAALNDAPSNMPEHAWWFGEDQARYIIAVDDPGSFEAVAATAGIPVTVIGTSGGADLSLPGGTTISVESLRQRHESWLPDYMGG